MNDEEIRIAALRAAIAWYHDCTDDKSGQIPRQLIVETAHRFEEYIRQGT